MGAWNGVIDFIKLLLFYLFVAVLFSLLSPWFLSFDNMMSIGANMAFIGLMCALQTPQ